MKIPAGVEPAFPVFQTGVLPLDYGILVGIVNAESERIEPVPSPNLECAAPQLIQS